VVRNREWFETLTSGLLVTVVLSLAVMVFLWVAVLPVFGLFYLFGC